MFSFLTHNDLRVTNHTLALPEGPESDSVPSIDARPFRLVQLSDMHFYEYTDPAYYARVAREVDALEPDVIVTTGDLIHYGPHYVDQAGEFLAGLKARVGKFSVLGNHDYADGARSAHIRAMLARADCHLLVNDHVRIALPDHNRVLWLAGLDDYKYGVPDLDAALAAVPRDGADPVVMLAHNPLHFDVVSKDPQTPVDLVLSGHTHAGHFYLPFLLPIYRYPLKMKYRYGFYEKDHCRLYVTSGLGGAAFYINLGFYKRGFPRFRYNSYPEVAVFDWVGAQQTEGAHQDGRSLQGTGRSSAVSQ